MTSQTAAIYCDIDGTPGADDTPGRLEFHTCPDGSSTAVERLRITSDGKVGINRTTPTAPITARRLDAGGSNSDGVIAEFANNGGYGVWFGQSSATGAAWGATTGDFYWCTSGLTNQVERLRIGSTGLITVNRDGIGGRIDATAGDSSIKILDGNGRSSIKVSDPGSGNSYEWELTSAGNFKAPNGKGIDFSSTADGSGTSISETFDDYEEGDFTPTCEFGSGGTTGMSLGTALGRYTKIGRVVRCEFTINFSAKGTSTGGFYIASLPFASQDNSRNRMVGIVPYFANVNSIEGHAMAYGGTPATRVPLYDATNGSTIINQGNINDDTLLRGVVTYNCN